VNQVPLIDHLTNIFSPDPITAPQAPGFENPKLGFDQSSSFPTTWWVWLLAHRPWDRMQPNQEVATTGVWLLAHRP